MSRFLLIITGSRTDYFSAPVTCLSVQEVKKAILEYRKYRLVNDPNAGSGLLALALRRRLFSIQNSLFLYGRQFFYDMQKGGKPMITKEDADFNVLIDPVDIISDAEHSLWKREDSSIFCPENEDLYQVVVIKDCL